MNHPSPSPTKPGMPAFSIIMATYNQRTTITEAIDSLLQQQYPHYELIIVDDGSTDGTEEYLLETYTDAIKNKTIRYIRLPKNKGVCFARNEGLKLAQHDWIGYLDSDNRMHTDFLATFAQAIQQYSQYEIFYAQIQHRLSKKVIGHAFDFEQLTYENYIDIGVFIHRRTVYHALGGFNPELSRLVDWDLILRYTEKYPPKFIEQVLLDYNDSEDINRITNKNPFAPNYKHIVLDYYQRMPEHQFVQHHQTIYAKTKELETTKEQNHLLEQQRQRDQSMITSLQHHLDEQHRTLDQLQQTIKEQKKQSKHDHREMLHQQEMLNKTKKEMQQYQNQILHLQQLLEQKEQDIQEKGQTIQAIKASWSWKITFPIRWIGKYPLWLVKKIYQGGKDIPLALKLLKREGLKAFFFRCYWYLKGKRLPNEIPLQETIHSSFSSQQYNISPGKKKLIFPSYTKPAVSIIIPVYNQFSYTYRCLFSILQNTTEIPYEVIVADDYSQDETKHITQYVKNIQVIRNKHNNGFLQNCNHAISSARGKYIVFLNNDTIVFPHCIETLVQTIEKDKHIGAVGGKLIFANQTLQEAGSIIWQDGSCLGYGRGEHPEHPAYNYVREVDYCSGALLLTPRKLFVQLGKFDQRYSPAYYEESDYCMSLRKNGFSVIYQPHAVVIHYEFATSQREKALQLQTRNKKLFWQKWKKALIHHLPPDPSHILQARDKKQYGGKILMIDDRIPDPKLGSGFPRAYALIHDLLKFNFFITFFPLQDQTKSDAITRILQQEGVEVFYRYQDTPLSLEQLLQERRGWYDVILVSRPHNMAMAQAWIRLYQPRAKIIYDAEAIYALRDIAYKKIIHKPLSQQQQQKLLQKEIALAKDVHGVLTVSQKEKKIFETFHISNVSVYDIPLIPHPTPKSFHDRKDILFVGGILSSLPENPNFDAVMYFVHDIFPLVQKKLGCHLFLVGTNQSPKIEGVQNRFIHVVGTVNDLFPYYNNCRVFIVPTRFAAGTPRKLIEAASYGLPSVITPLIAEQMEWQHGKETLVGKTPLAFSTSIITLYTDESLWNHIRKNAIHSIREKYKPALMRQHLKSIFDAQ